MKSFLQHIHEAPMTTGGSSPLDQSTEDGRTIPAFPGLPNFTPGDPASYDNPDDAPRFKQPRGPWWMPNLFEHPPGSGNYYFGPNPNFTPKKK